MRIGWALALLGALCASVSADLVSVVDPPGLGEIDEEIGNLSQTAFEALVPVVNDHENGTGPQSANDPFSIGSVGVTGIYGAPVTANFSGNRSSFTQSGTDASGNPVGTWVNAGVSATNGSQNYVKFIFAAGAGEFVKAAGLAWMGRDNRSLDSTLLARVTFADGTTLEATIVIDGTGDGLPNGKDVFIGFIDDGGYGGITMLEVFSTPNGTSIQFFHGWDDIGVVTALGQSPAPVPEPGTLVCVALAGAAALLRRSRGRQARS